MKSATPVHVHHPEQSHIACPICHPHNPTRTECSDLQGFYSPERKDLFNVLLWIALQEV